MYQLRNYKMRDAAAINLLAVECFAQFKDIFNDWTSFKKGLLAFSELSLLGEIVVAEGSSSNIVGAVAYIPSNIEKADYFPKSTPVIRMLIVDPKFRGTGLGKTLALDCISRARRDNCSSIALHTSNIMEVALPMYLRMGFSLFGPAPEILGVGYNVYAKNLSD